MNILITGATGFLGSYLLQELAAQDHKLIIIKRSNSARKRIENILALSKVYDIDKVNLEDIFSEQRIDMIIHLATNYGRRNNNNISEILKTNFIFPSELLALGLKYNSFAFINTHTCAPPNYSVYAASKHSFYVFAEGFSSIYDFKVINLQFDYIFGAGDDLTKFIPNLLQALIEGKPISATAGEQKRDFIYVKDAVSAYLKTLERLDEIHDKFVTFEIGSGKSTSLREFALMSEKIIGKPACIRWGELSYRKNELFESRTNNILTNKVLNWSPRYTLEEGLRETINQMRLSNK